MRRCLIRKQLLGIQSEQILGARPEPVLGTQPETVLGTQPETVLGKPRKPVLGMPPPPKIPLSFVLLLAIFLPSCLHRVPDPMLEQPFWPEHHYAATEDGWQLSLYRYLPFFRGAVQDDEIPDELWKHWRLPVILCHGLASNYRTFDLTEELSLSRYLADRGYDVWILELRGHGDSRPPSRIDNPDGWSFDQHALLDVPAAIRYVQEVSGAAQVNWVGHSMGGMIMYAYLASTGDERVRNVVALGSPGTLDFSSKLIHVGIKAIPFAALFPRVNLRVPSRIWSRVSGRIPGGFEEAIWHLDNMAPDTAQLMLAVGIENIERGVQRSFQAMLDEGSLVSRDDKMDYLSKLENFKASLLAVAAKFDGLAPPYNVLQMVDRVGTTDKTYELISRTNGYSVDYGHVDMAVGDHARQDIYPLVFRWLDARQTHQKTSASN